MSALGDHPHVDPGDGRTECYLCGKFVHDVIHSCKGVPVTRAAEWRVRALIDAVRNEAASDGGALAGVKADALREAADEGDMPTGVRMWLRARAVRIVQDAAHDGEGGA